MRLSGRDIGLIELDGRARKSALGIASLALQARSRSHCSRDDVRLVVGFQIGFRCKETSSFIIVGLFAA